ncbi:MAG: lipopolysaccharide heptosyltransferase I [Thermodesulfovibrionales bacterium]|nr:lipopolysaccharide heptosyltransferase I [Thermodesulfovibrionales bacterium]
MLKACKYNKILIVKPSSMGDVIHSLPVLNAINANYPDAEIHWVIAKGLEDLLQTHPMVKKLWVIDKDKWKKVSAFKHTIHDIVSLSRQLQNEHYDVVIDLQGLLRSGLITGLSKAPVRIGFSKGREFSPIFYNIRVKVDKDTHAVTRYMKTLQALGCLYDKIEFPMPLIKPSRMVEDIIKRYTPYYVVIPGARWKTKQWMPERFAEVISRLDDICLIVGSGADRQIGDTICSLSQGKAVNLAGETTIQSLICLIRHAKGVISNDTGPMHIAAALKKPLVAIFGPTNPLRTGPFSEGCRVVQTNISCVPCYKKKCERLTCMKEIKPDMVLDAFKQLMK